MGRPPPLATPMNGDRDATCVGAGQVRCRCAVERAISRGAAGTSPRRADLTRDSGFAGSSFLVHRQPPPEQKPRSTLLDNSSCERTDNAMDSTRAAIEEHWSASECGNTEAEHAIYAAEAILDYPQSGERFRGRTTIAAQRGGHPADRHFTVRRITGSGDLWVSECIITYDGVPTYSVSIMEFAHEKVVHETQYFADTFRAPAWRKALAEPMPADTSIPPDPWPGGRPCSVLTRRHSTAVGSKWSWLIEKGRQYLLLVPRCVNARSMLTRYGPSTPSRT